MCKEYKHNWFNHLLGRCKHESKVATLQAQIVETRSVTTEDLEKFNHQLNLLIKDKNIRITLTNIKKVTKNV